MVKSLHLLPPICHIWTKKSGIFQLPDWMRAINAQTFSPSQCHIFCNSYLIAWKRFPFIWSHFRHQANLAAESQPRLCRDGSYSPEASIGRRRWHWGVLDKCGVSLAEFTMHNLYHNSLDIVTGMAFKFFHILNIAFNFLNKIIHEYEILKNLHQIFGLPLVSNDLLLDVGLGVG